MSKFLRELQNVLILICHVFSVNITLSKVYSSRKSTWHQYKPTDIWFIIWMKIYNIIIFWFKQNHILIQTKSHFDSNKIIFWFKQNHILIQTKSYFDSKTKSYFDSNKIIFWFKQNHILIQTKSYFDSNKIIFWFNQNNIIIQSKSSINSVVRRIS